MEVAAAASAQARRRLSVDEGGAFRKRRVSTGVVFCWNHFYFKTGIKHKLGIVGGVFKGSKRLGRYFLARLDGF